MKSLIEKAVERAILGDEPEKDCGIGGHKIVICQRGFIYAGDVSISGNYLTIANAVNIRRWGTATGLGELAEHGTRPESTIDEVGTVRVHELAVVAMIDCRERINATT